MKILTGIIALAILSFTVVIVGWGGYLMIESFTQNYKLMSLQTETVMSFSVMLMAVVVLFIVLGIRGSAKMLVNSKLNNRRLEIYLEITNNYMKILDNSTSASGMAEFQNILSVYRNELFLLSGAAVLDSIMELEKQLSGNEYDQIVASAQNMLKSMRHELVLSSSLEETRYLNTLHKL